MIQNEIVMKAPDKIYLCSDSPRMYDWQTKPFKKGGNVEYICKDVLLEWAERLKERWEEPPMSRYSPGCVYMLEQLINKLNSL